MKASQSTPQAAGSALPGWLPAALLAVPLVVVITFGALMTPPGRFFTLDDPLIDSASSRAASGRGMPAQDASSAAGSSTRSTGAATSGATTAGSNAEAPPDIEKMVERLATRLQSQPDDARGWNTLAHSYYVLKRFPDAVKAYERLIDLSAPDADTLADYADALAMAQGRVLSGKPMELVKRAIELDPRHWKALSMAGTEAFVRKDYRSAIEYWSRGLEAAAPGSENARVLQANLEEARQLAAQTR